MPFLPGQSGNPGGKRSRQKAEVQALLDTAWSHASRKRVVRRLAAQAEEGDTLAAKLLLEYAYGKPAQSVSLSNDGDNPLVVVNAISYRSAITVLAPEDEGHEPAQIEAGPVRDSGSPGEG